MTEADAKLSIEEIKTSDMIARKIVSDCLLYRNINISTCIKERISGLSYILDVGKSLPKSHPLRKQTSKISDIVNSIKDEIFIIIAKD